MPLRLVVHGPPGVGKSTFAAGSPDHVIIDVERRTGHIDANARFEPKSWDETLAFLGECYTTKQFKTVVVDTLDHLEFLLWDMLCKREGVSSIEFVGGGYGKGYKLALDQWRRFAKALEALRSVGVTTVCLAHSQVKEFKNPAGENYDHYVVKIHEKASALLRESVDAVGFAHYEDVVRKADKNSKAKALTTGDRVLTFKHDPAFETKRGVELPDEVPLEWAALEAAISKETK